MSQMRNHTDANAAGDLDPRKRQILKTLVDEYIDSAEPVGSKTLVDKYDLQLSPASVRNSLAELEHMGYLEQPHTSSGRVPSDLGYRAYVDSLMTLEAPDPEVQEEIRRCLADSFNELPELLRAASGLLSETTGYTSVALTPTLKESKIRQIKILMIEPGRALVVVVLSPGLVKDRMMRIPDLLSQSRLREIAEALEKSLGGTALADITMVTVATALQGISLPEPLLNQILYETYVSIKQAENLETYIDGLPNIFAHPEFQHPGKARAIIDALHRDGLIVGLMEEQEERLKLAGERTSAGAEAGEAQVGGSGNSDSQPVLHRGTAIRKGKPCFMIRIGQEIEMESLRDCSFVTSTYRLNDRISGNIAIVGPKRMQYARVISQIAFVQQSLDHLLNGADSSGKENQKESRES